jgi:serine/threonine protein kinase
MAPEIIVDNHIHSLPVDIWSLGVLMYYVMTFEYPFMGNPYVVSLKIVEGKYNQIPSKNDGGLYSNELIDLVNSMLVVVCEPYFCYNYVQDEKKRITADMILNNPIFKNYLEYIIGSDILDVLKKKKIPLRDVARDPVLVSVLKRYSSHKDGIFLCCCLIIT